MRWNKKLSRLLDSLELLTSIETTRHSQPIRCALNSQRCHEKKEITTSKATMVVFKSTAGLVDQGLREEFPANEAHSQLTNLIWSACLCLRTMPLCVARSIRRTLADNNQLSCGRHSGATHFLIGSMQPSPTSVQVRHTLAYANAHPICICVDVWITPGRHPTIELAYV